MLQLYKTNAGVFENNINNKTTLNAQDSQLSAINFRNNNFTNIKERQHIETQKFTWNDYSIDDPRNI